MKSYVIAVGIVKFNEEILILKRNSTKRFDPNKWEFVSGFIKEHEVIEDTVLREVKEETDQVGEIVKSAKSFEVTDNYGRWIIVPFIIKVNSKNIILDPKEHTEFKWIKAKEIEKFDSVSDLKKDLEIVGLL